MSFLPQNTELGDLNLYEVYQYYDRPLLFSCVNATDNYFLALWTDDDTEFDKWLYLGVSKARLNTIRSGGIDLYEAFQIAENGTVLEVNIPQNGHGTTQIRVIPVDEIEAELLPEPGTKIELETATLPDIENDISRKAQQASREIFTVSLKFAKGVRTEAPAKELGVILESLQETIYAIGARLNQKEGTSGQITQAIRSAMGLSVVRVGHGSFRVELASAEFADMFKYTKVGDAINELVTLASLGSNADSLREYLQQLTPLVASKYLKFLQAIGQQSVDDTYLEWASPDGTRRRDARVSALTANEAIELLETFAERITNQIKLPGVFNGANIRTKQFEIETEEDTYKGKISDQAMPSVTRIRLGEIVLATLSEVIEFSVATGEETTRYTLLNLERREQDTSKLELQIQR